MNPTGKENTPEEVADVYVEGPEEELEEQREREPGRTVPPDDEKVRKGPEPGPDKKERVGPSTGGREEELPNPAPGLP